MSKAFDLSAMTGDELRFLVKPMPTYNNVLMDQSELKRHIVLSQPQQQAMRRPAQSSIFSRLPIEVVFTIFENMSMDSIFRFRASSTHLKALVESWRPFQIIMSDAGAAVQALIATQASKVWTVTDLQHRVYSTQCELCNNHGEILHLLKMQRVCFNCVTVDRRLLAISPNYAMNVMHLPHSEIATLPLFRTIPQKSFWGWSKGTDFALDYTSALDLAMKQQPMRDRGLHLPSFLLNPPESSYLQHACCTYLPAQKQTISGTMRIKAALCAGCVYYWNYHSGLPHQCHTLHPHDIYSQPNNGKSSHTQLMTHISQCVFAKAYWNKLYLPSLNHLNSSNIHLTSNGGQYTTRQLIQEQQVRLVSLFSQKQARFRHFYRHPETADGQLDQSGSDNNERFDEIPRQLLQVAKTMAVIQHRTALDIELGIKKQVGDAQICDALSDENNWRLNSQGKKQLSQVQREEKIIEENGTNSEFDIYADVLLGSGASVSQSSWALARTTGYNNLFGGWSQLLEERKMKEAEAMARDTGGKVEKYRRAIRGWGMDRFGCVSSLG